MKRRFFLPILTAAARVTDRIAHNVASAQFSRRGPIESMNEPILTPEESARWQAVMQQQYFEVWFEGIELAPEEEQFARTELARNAQVWNEWVDRAEVKGRDLTNAEVQALDDKFLASLEPGFNPDQIQQVRDNLTHGWF